MKNLIGEFQSMIVVMKSGTPAEEIERVSQELCRSNCT